MSVNAWQRGYNKLTADLHDYRTNVLVAQRPRLRYQIAIHSLLHGVLQGEIINLEASFKNGALCDLRMQDVVRDSRAVEYLLVIEIDGPLPGLNDGCEILIESIGCLDDGTP